jgi:hypothetical protein
MTQEESLMAPKKAAKRSGQDKKRDAKSPAKDLPVERGRAKGVKGGSRIHGSDFNAATPPVWPRS